MRTKTEIQLEITNRHPLIGTEVRGIDLSQPINDATYLKLHELWMENLLLIFPNQPISDDALGEFGRRFGQLEIHPSLEHRASQNQEIYRVANTDEQGNIVPPNNTFWKYLKNSWRWHSDSSFRKIPSKGSILHGIEITNAGGNTLFANMYAAYDALEETLKRQIENLWVIHDHNYIMRLSPELTKTQNKGKYVELPPVRHPLIQIHPITKRRCLFLSPHTMVNIDGMDPSDGRALLDQLIDHATKDKFIYRHVWVKDDVIMWDNRCTMHYALNDYAQHRRKMHRITIKNDCRASKMKV